LWSDGIISLKSRLGSGHSKKKECGLPGVEVPNLAKSGRFPTVIFD